MPQLLDRLTPTPADKEQGGPNDSTSTPLQTPNKSSVAASADESLDGDLPNEEFHLNDSSQDEAVSGVG